MLCKARAWLPREMVHTYVESIGLLQYCCFLALVLTVAYQLQNFEAITRLRCKNTWRLQPWYPDLDLSSPGFPFGL
jgi:hypothetical protein